ncbi:hypothetical protein DH2020_024573 [Rehmannia glutinosa]|uniref:Uncharacterized protein n=1 Tax=Rehmannia glutinosa TaxID=99300 RepID=A0ABR0W2Y0_REHGL
MSFSFSSGNNLFKTLLIISALLIYLIFIFLPNQHPNCSASHFFSPFKTKVIPSSETKTCFVSPTITTTTNSSQETNSPTNLSHLGFGLLGSEKAWHNRKAYIESWWRPNATRGLLYLDKNPAGDDILPWSTASPPYRVSNDDLITGFLGEIKPRDPVMIRMVYAIMEVFRELDNENLRWLVMGDDDSVFFVDNIVDVLAQYDHMKYYYLGGQSEFIMSNYWYSFNQGFGGAGFMLSYPLAKALANDMENCLRRHAGLSSADLITMIDLRGDISGFLSSHPKFPLISLHHLDKVDPIFPNMDRFESTRHLMKAAVVDQSRMLQQTICHHRQTNWSFSISWGYSAHIYEKIMPRSHLQNPIETFEPWSSTPRPPPQYMFNTRVPSNDSCEAPHVFFFKKVKKASAGILTTYSRAAPRGLPPCWISGGKHSAEVVSEIRVLSPTTQRKEIEIPSPTQ